MQQQIEMFQPQPVSRWQWRGAWCVGPETYDAILKLRWLGWRVYYLAGHNRHRLQPPQGGPYQTLRTGQLRLLLTEIERKNAKRKAALT